MGAVMPPLVCVCCHYSVWAIEAGGKAQEPCRRCSQGCTNTGCHTLRPNPNGVYGRFQRVDNTWRRILGRLGRGPSVGS